MLSDNMLVALGFALKEHSNSVEVRADSLDNLLTDIKRLLRAPFRVNVPESCPYDFSAKTLMDAVTLILKNRRNGADILTWNIKAYTAHHSRDLPGDFERNPALDLAWEEYLASSGCFVHGAAQELAQQNYEEWTSYPGDDQGDWIFSHTSNYLILDSWRGTVFARMPTSSFISFVGRLVANHVDGSGELLAFYKGMVTADKDFTPENATEDLSAAYSTLRQEWEESRERIASKLLLTIRRSCLQTLLSYGFSGKSLEDPGIIADLMRLVEKIYEAER